ncbi:hypothetical protein SNOG_16102 [Parastagonospora nodorum SN15]|uniref:Elongator complex protein 2 n=1 Tax=Phaeosphaeria nodorum (strain SN15 / ATCC MYA-4574 / FGSC 10173) TaxID=321614 RepID=Q0TWH0_PHANO|nr:hypothetical protein SNOG_16102 [Parastagonospora nodorum SN15]EAT76474.2 hypothetical protein SNOG_16102 [Parastagonospora nodorum SN15]
MELLRKVQERTNLNSIVIGTPPSLDISDFTLSGIGEVVSLACGNRNPAAADWDEDGLQLLAFGADNSIALWDPQARSDTFATGASDGTVKIWKLVHDATYSSVDVELVQNITLSPNYFPLNLALAHLDDQSIILAAAGTRSTIQIFVSHHAEFQLSATLTGHEGWIRALAFTREVSNDSSDLLLVSASQDKYIRLWRIHRGNELPAASSALNDPSLGGLGKSLSNKAHWIESRASKFSVTFEALLLGHEDWIYTASWRHRDGKLQLLSTSEDNSLAIWESDPTSGIWICTTRLGEISAQKGSTSATGSAGGLWIGLWSPDSNSIVALGRTGSWRKWSYSITQDTWTQEVAITGHVREVKGIHGYDLNCIDAISTSQFISGADEKLLRVFDEPKGVAAMLKRLCDIQITNTGSELPDAANIPVLGLSNKAIQAVDDSLPIEDGDDDERETVDPASIIRKSTLNFSHPPFEDHLARHLLWPETEKLYGHGYEISAVAVSRDGSLVATACRASSIDHAVIRLYDTKDWLEVKPPLRAHSLTVTALQFSPDDKYLLSVGRDRQWVIWERGAEASQYTLKHSNPKGHTRMILDASWTPLEQPTFMTAGRDKSIKTWQVTDADVQLKGTATVGSAVTAVACSSQLHQGSVLFAFATDNGEIGICKAATDALDKVDITMIKSELCPAKTVNQLVWRPARTQDQQQVAVVSDDTSMRLYDIKAV